MLGKKLFFILPLIVMSSYANGSATVPADQSPDDWKKILKAAPAPASEGSKEIIKGICQGLTPLMSQCHLVRTLNNGVEDVTYLACSKLVRVLEVCAIRKNDIK
jgi:hypothetical protein